MSRQATRLLPGNIYGACLFLPKALIRCSVLMRGFCRRCPRCGEGRLFSGYLSVPESCDRCRLAFEPIRADDAPAYFTIFLVGHIVVPGLLLVEQWYAPLTWVQPSVWLPATLILTLGLLSYIKGAVMAAIWSPKTSG